MSEHTIKSKLANSLFAACLLAIVLIASPLQSLAAELNISSNQLPIPLGQYLDYFEDSSAELGIEDVLAGEFDWQRSSETIPTLGMTTSAYWFHVDISSRSAIEEELVLGIDSAVLDRAEIYTVINGEVVQRSLTGDRVAFSEIDIPYRIPVSSLELAPPGQTTSVYIRALSTAGVEMPLVLTTMNLLAQEQQTQLTFFGAFFALFFISFCVCAAFYFNMKDREFQGYTLFFAAAIPFFLSQSGMGRVWFWGELASANNRIAFVAAVFLVVSMCQLGRAVSIRTRHRDAIDLVLRYVNYLMLPVGLYMLFAPIDSITPDTVQILMFVGLSTALCVVILAGITAIQGSRSALFLFASWMFIILAYSSFLFYKFTLVERSAVSGIVGESLMLVAALMLLMSLFELVRSKNEEMDRIQLETRAKGDFLRNVSREFLTPVHLILANSKRLLDADPEAGKESSRECIDTVITQSNHLHNLINDLLEMAELESDSFEPEFELVEMSHFLSSIHEALLPSAMEKGLDFSTEFASANLLIQTDKMRLQHALMNIATNAIRYTDKGAIKLGYKAIYFRRRLGIEIHITDTGRGMSEEFKQQMFQEFARENPGSEKDPQGTGLGMVIVKRMIEKLGGEISFESTLGSGSQFFIRMPLRVVSE